MTARRPRTPVVGRRSAVALAGTGLLAATAAACSNADPLAEDTAAPDGGASDGGGAGGTIVVGSQQYYSNEIIAELYAQVLEAAGLTVDRQYQIGPREVYMPELESGAIDLLPEYLGNLLQYVDPEAAGGTADELSTALGEALPEGLRVLDHAEATDQDSYTTTAAYASENSLVSIADLAGIDGLQIAANPEFEDRPYGPAGAQEIYGVSVTVLPVSDSGGPLTLQALLDGTTQLADIYTADPAIAANDLVTLEDPEAMILPQNVAPLVSAKIDETAAAALAPVTAALTTEELIALNTRSVDEQLDSATIAGDWLAEKGLV